jgi:integrase
VLLAIPNVTDSARRRYAAAWRLCVTFLRRRVSELADPFSFAGEWLPRNGASRTTWWAHAQTLTVLDRMPGEPRRAMALIYGTGMELGALRNLKHSHILADRTITANGTKNDYRRGRTVICDAWAWAIFNEGRAPGFPTMPIFTATDHEIRNAFYTAQVDAQFISAPKRSRTTSKRLWGDVAGLHHIHDARHSFAVVRLLGLDGEPKLTMKFVAANLGHSDETMTMRIYSKAGVAQRHDLTLEEIAADSRFQSAAQ